MDSSRHRDVEYIPPPAADDQLGPSGGGGGAPAGAPLLPPGIGMSSPRAGRGRGRGGSGGRGGGPVEGGGGGGRGRRGPPRQGQGRGRGGPPPPGMAGRGPPMPPPFPGGGGRGGGGGGGRGPWGPPPPMSMQGGPGPGPGPVPAPGAPGSKLEAKLQRREERHAAMLKRQVAAMEVSPTMLTRADLDHRDSILQGGPDVAPDSSYEELPAAQHCYWADTLLIDQAQLQVQAAPAAATATTPPAEHAAAMAAAMQLHDTPLPGSVFVTGKLGRFAVDKHMASLLSSS